MAYFLKKTKNKKGIYLQIYESYYDPERKGGAHRSYKPLGYVHELIDKGIDDPIIFYSEEIKKLNQERLERKQKEKERLISDESPEKLLGFFPVKNLNDSLGVKKYIDLMQTATDFRFCVADLIDALIYARVVHPCSKSKTFEEVIPKLFGTYEFSIRSQCNRADLELAGSKSARFPDGRISASWCHVTIFLWQPVSDQVAGSSAFRGGSHRMVPLCPGWK